MQATQQQIRESRKELARSIAYRKSGRLREENVNPFFVLAALPFAGLYKSRPNRRKRNR